MKQDIKAKIISATIELIEEKASKPQDITVRDICKKAGIGLGQINYHFQTKENLIARCVQEIIGNVISRVPRNSPLLQGETAVQTLKLRMYFTMNYLYANENISRISILTDHQDGRGGDNTQQTIQRYIPPVEAACRERSIDVDPVKWAMMMILAFQGIFLRTDIIKELMGIDLRNEAARNQFIDDYIESAFSKG